MKLVVRIMHEVDLPRGKQLVLMGMAENANDDGTGSRPSVDLVAWKAGYMPRRAIAIMRELEQDGIIVKAREAAQHRAAEWDIHVERAPQKVPFEEWRKAHGRYAARPARDAIFASLGDDDGGAPGVQNGGANRPPGVQRAAPLEDDPGMQSRGNTGPPGVQSPASGVQNGDSGVQSRSPRGATVSAPEPLNRSYEPSYEPVGGSPPRPTDQRLVAVFFDSLSEVREARGTPKDDRTPVPSTGPWSRGRISADVARELEGGRDPGLVERSLCRMALRWDSRRLELADAMGDVQGGKPWSLEQERQARAVLSGDVPRGESGAERRKEGYAWLFGEEDQDPPPADAAPVQDAPEPEPEPERDPWEGSAFADVVPHEAWGDLADGKVAAAIRVRLLQVAGEAPEAEYEAAVEELRRAPWVGEGFKESVIGKAEQMRREAG
jgi:hypothetical protein